MKYVGFSKILILILFCFLLFGDFPKFKKKLMDISRQCVSFFLKKSSNRKKGI